MRKAKTSDLNNIMKVIDLTVKEMKQENNTQWDERYPIEEDFLVDIEKGTLYVEEVDGEFKGFICVDFNQPKEYDDINWSSNKESMVIHRMAVNPACRRQGIGQRLIKFADELAIENKANYIKTDTYSINTKMDALFKKCGFVKVGEMDFLGKEKPFYCYDKLI
ncbi:GNAT family N-acetyltransferase [Romboutsia weinsteinii]|uniref:GNAT family N-acetyltransferase n=1 Tax=Romboutsia weinsteinii TaxID=2020949 RepID=A0A371J2I3_9FIRM|nr:GNAT family N-acetyltransferase [Romboutsia weinsteinii]RDY27012.1 GNAT family N-acetyltransferase [Romboutsia weinsteinii]